MKNLKRPNLNAGTSDDLQDSSPKPKRKKAKLCYVKMETNEGSQVNFCLYVNRL